MKRKKVKALLAAMLLAANALFLAKYLQYKKAYSVSQADLGRLTRIADRLSGLEKSAGRIGFLEFIEFASRHRSPLFYRILKSTFHSAQKFRLNPYLVLSLIYLESGFNPQAVSSRGAYGLMQINYAVWKEKLHLEAGRLCGIEYNIENGCLILRHYLNESGGDLARALYLYNNGYAADGNVNYPNLVLQGKFSARTAATAG